MFIRLVSQNYACKIIGLYLLQILNVILAFYRSRYIACRGKSRTTKHSSCRYRFPSCASQKHRQPSGNPYVIARGRELRLRLRHRKTVLKLQIFRWKGRRGERECFTGKIFPFGATAIKDTRKYGESKMNVVMRGMSNLSRNLCSLLNYKLFFNFMEWK